MALKKFSEFVNDVYSASKERTIENNLFGMTVTKPSLYGRIYIGNSSPSFRDIEEHIKGETPIFDYLKSLSIEPDMLHLKSRINDTEGDIYEWHYKSHKIKGNKIIVETKNNSYVFEI